MPQPTAFHSRLRGSRAIVTGAGSLGSGVGTGKAIAALFAAESCHVGLVDLDRDRAEQTLALVESLVPRSRPACASPRSIGSAPNFTSARAGSNRRNEPRSLPTASRPIGDASLERRPPARPSW